MINTAWALALTVALQSAAPATAVPTGPSTAQQAPSAPAAPAGPAPADAWPDDRPLTHLFPNLGRDLKASPSRDSAFILAIGGAAALAAHQTDDRLSNWAVRSGTSSYTTVGRALGDGWTQAGAAVGVYAIGKLAGQAQAVHVGGDLIRAQAMNGLITTALKVAVDRTRPNGSNHAFPSGHTSAAFASAAVLQGHYGWKVGLPAYAVAGFVGWTRVRDDVHWLSDVVFGAAVGTLAGHTVTKDHHGARWVVVPAPVKGGMGFVVARLR